MSPALPERDQPAAAADAPASPVGAARALYQRIVASADRIERDRRLPAELVDALAAGGLFRMCLPRAVGGGETEPALMLEAIEEVARADGSAGWCAMIGATSGVVAGYLSEEVAAEIVGGDSRVVLGGVYAPMGRAAVADGGYRVSGRWAFASGCEHCTWLMGGCVVQDDARARLLPGGAPESRLMLFPAAEARVIDTWTVSGLRGTGSHDIAVTDLFVPAGRAVSLATDRPRAPGALYRFPVFGLLALGIAAVALGIARRAIDELATLAAAKTPTGSRRRLAERAAVQAEVAEAEALLRAARAFLREAVAEAWASARKDSELPIPLRAMLRLAATHATAGAARAVDLMYRAGGGSAVYADSPLQRCFRDVHVVTQHMMVAPPTWELAGRILLGVDVDTSML